MYKNKNMALRQIKGFTLIELMIVVVILGVIAAFSIPNYSKSVERTYERDASVNLMAIYASEKIYFNNNGSYAGGKDMAALNTALELGLIANGLSYACNATSLTFECTAAKDNNTFTLKVTNDKATPCCAAGDCPSAPKCAS